MTEPTEPPRPPEGMRFNAPPGWPPPPPGWVPTAEFAPDPSWPDAPGGWPWWVPAGGPDLEKTSVLPAPPDAEPPPGSPFGIGPPPPTGPRGAPGSQRSWVSRHRLLTAALVVVTLLVLAGGTAGAVLVANRNSDDPGVSAPKAPRPQSTPSLPPLPQTSPPPSGDATSPEHKAACDKASGPNDRAVALVQAYGTKRMTNAAVIAALPAVQADLTAAAHSASGVLQRDLQEYAAAVGAFRTTLVQGRDASTAAAKVLIYSVVLNAECNF